MRSIVMGAICVLAGCTAMAPPFYGQAAVMALTEKDISLGVALLQKAGELHPDKALNEREETAVIALLQLNAAEAASFHQAAQSFNSRLRQLRQSEIAIMATTNSVTDVERAKVEELVTQKTAMARALAVQFLSGLRAQTLASCRARLLDK